MKKNIKKVAHFSSNKAGSDFIGKNDKDDEQIQGDKNSIVNTKKKIRLEKLKSNTEREQVLKKDKSNKFSRKEKIRLGINNEIKQKETQQIEKNNNRLILLIEKRQRQINNLITKKAEEIEEGVKNLSPEEIKQLHEKYIKIIKRIKFIESKIIKDITDENVKNKFLIYINTIAESIKTKKQNKTYLDKIKNIIKYFTTH